MAGSLGVPLDLVPWHGQRLDLWSILLGGGLSALASRGYTGPACSEVDLRIYKLVCIVMGSQVQQNNIILSQTLPE
jgi:hypothetical protein